MNEKIGMYTEDEILEHLTEGEGRGFLGRSMYDAIFDKIHALKTENKQLKDNWNKLKEYLNYKSERAVGEDEYVYDEIYNEMRELEQGSDSNE